MGIFPGFLLVMFFYFCGNLFIPVVMFLDFGGNVLDFDGNVFGFHLVRFLDLAGLPGPAILRP